MEEEFKFKSVKTEAVHIMFEMRDQFNYLLKDISKHLPESRELSIIKTHLEEANMWFNKKMAELHEADANE